MKKGILAALAIVSVISLAGCQTMAGENVIQPKDNLSQNENGSVNNDSSAPSSNLEKRPDVVAPTEEPAIEGTTPAKGEGETGSEIVREPEVVSSDTNVSLPTKKPTASTPPNMGITVNKINFKELTGDEISDAIKQAIESHKMNKGYEYFIDDQSAITLVVYAGEKTSGGYGIQVKYIEDNEGKTNVLVEETKPKEGSFNITVMSYPYTVVKMTGTTDDFHVENASGQKYSPVK